ncbi:beta-N-acetylhexosaminidase [Parabacteroides sp. PFB2-10]|uniref:glycoside hydrolase family 3 N-terminal domain-containing protein n=1 Tax=Parabacteroides sp. PFB2-10 TaxID=1742405 RepID=UPI0024742EA5|nr:glycoside hydrolase family 3 N-terminal domain-containing protein [Parabacteroides sp. PFB2-10]MDH6312392.1 beta-N-acetylhexosaminidase [Parabacteroides sp. PFB2-10]
MRRLIILLSFCGCVFSGLTQTVPELYRKADKEKMNHWVDSVFDTLTLDERIGQLFMPVANPTTDNRNIQLLMRYVNEAKIGGILFHKGDAVTQAEVTNRVQKASKIPMLVSLDGEWGLSMRLDGTTRFPKNMMLGAIEDINLIEAYGEEVGRQCNEMGIHINFAPDVDVNSNMANPVIGIRSFGEDPDAVAEKGIAYARGIEKKGVLSVAKHFPGHGDTSDDSHHTLPAVRHSMERLDSVELLPFKRYIYEGFAGVMTGHLYVPTLDKTPNLPSSLSKPIVTGLLQQKLGFQGLCFTDALAMKGASTKSSENPSVKALLAGNDILLAPASLFTDVDAVRKAVQEGVLDRSEIEAKCLKVLQYKYITGLHNYQPVELKGLSERLNTPHAAWLVAKLNAEAITLMKNDDDYLPLKGIGKKKIAALSLGDGVETPYMQMLGRYDKIDRFQLLLTSTEAQVREVYRQLENYDVILCAVHTIRVAESEQLRQLATRKEVVLTFFTLPYSCRQYRQSIDRSKAAVMAYEATPLAQEYAAQLIMGGIAAKGKLPVSIPGLYFAGTGLFTEKSRLGYQEPEEVGLDPVRLDVIESIVQEGLDEEAYPGCQVLVAKEGMVVYHKAFGYQDEKKTEPVTLESVYDLASVSKAAGTLLAAMKAYDEKKFTLNQKVSTYLPELQGTDKKDITIRELLYHQSGLVSTINFYLKAIDQDSYSGSLYSGSRRATHPVRFDAKTFVRNDFTYLPDLVSTTPKEGFATQVAKDFYVAEAFQDSIMTSIIDSRLVAKGRYRYSCINFILLKMLVEREMGQSMDELLQNDFFSRLGAQTMMYNPVGKIEMQRIVPTEDDQFVRRQLLRGYVHDEAAAFQGGVSGNAGLFSTAHDLAKVCQLYLNQGVYGRDTLITQETARLFTQSKSPSSRRGLGFDKPDRGNVRNSPCGALAPASVFGHTGYTGTCFWVDPDNQLVYIFLTNRLHPSRANTKLFSLETRMRIQDAIYKAIERK